jgi:hypothetical protein
MAFLTSRAHMANPECAHCDKPGAALRCGACRVTNYCSRSCQKADWPRHKPACAASVDARKALSQLRLPSALPAAAAEVSDIEDLIPNDPLIWTTISQVRAGSAECGCERCAQLCRIMPGCYDPVHFLQTLEAGRLPENLVLDYRFSVDDGGEGFVLGIRPSAEGEASGSVADIIPVGGACMNLGRDGCQLSRGERPTGCLAAHPCNPRLNHSIDKSVLQPVWGGDAGRAAIAVYLRHLKRKDPSWDGVQDCMRELPRACTQEMLSVQTLLEGVRRCCKGIPRNVREHARPYISLMLSDHAADPNLPRTRAAFGLACADALAGAALAGAAAGGI